MSEVNTSAADTTNADANTAEVSAADKLYPDTAAATATAEAKAASDVKEDASKPQETEAKKDDAQAVPDKYEFEVDEDSPISDEHLDKIAAYAKERGLSQEAAQKLVDMQAETLKTQQENLSSEFKKTADGWRDAARADKEIGGDGFNRNVELAKRVVDKFASAEFKKALNETGFGNHPELLRTFVRIAAAVGEDTLVVPGASSSKAKSFEDLFYGSKN